MGESAEQKEAKKNDILIQRNQLEQQKRSMAIQQQAFQQIQPFANMLLQWGIDPAAFLASPQGQAMLAPIQESIGKDFSQARMNLLDAFGSSGQLGSGITAGPLANLTTDEIKAMTGAKQNLLGQGLNLGLQGGNLLSGQQAIFNPVQAGSAGTIDPRMLSSPNILGSIFGGLAGVATGGLSNIIGRGGGSQKPYYGTPPFFPGVRY